MGGGPFVPVIHGVRGAAVLVVVFYHIIGGVGWQPSHGALLASGFMGIDVLFFVSGFVLLLPVALTGTLGGVAGWGVRRFARIAPAYYASLLVITLAYPLLLSPALLTFARHAGLTSLHYYAIHLLFLQQEVYPLSRGFIVDVPVWTLSIDIVFYLLLPFIAAIYTRHPIVGVVLGLAAATAWRLAFLQLHTPEGLQNHLGLLIQFPLFAGDLACGMTAACAFVLARRREWDRLHPRALVATAVLGLAGLLVLGHIAGSNLPYRLGAEEEPIWVSALFPVTLGVFVVALALCPRRIQWPLVNRPSLWFSEISYSVYLYHFPLFFFAVYTLGVKQDGHFPITMTLAVVPACIAIATVSYLLVERPARRLGRRIALRITPKLVAVAAATGPSSTSAPDVR